MKATPCPYCQGFHKVVTKYGIGSEICAEKSSEQNVDQCGCGAWRSHTDVTPFNSNQPTNCLDKWQGKENAWAPEPWEL